MLIASLLNHLPAQRDAQPQKATPKPEVVHSQQAGQVGKKQARKREA
jgi:hypothetical protein